MLVQDRMNIALRLAASCLSFVILSHSDQASAQDSSAKHLFILSGQSNMAGLRPEESFVPAVNAVFGSENVLVVKDAQSGQPIRRWFEGWQDAKGESPASTGDLYSRLMKKVKAAIKDQSLASVTLVWMQGERDAKEGHGSVYGKSLNGLLRQVERDIPVESANLVVGRLSDFGLDKKNIPDWIVVRDQQMKLAEANPNMSWVDTDDLNDGKNRRGKEISNDLHYSADGYTELGRRFAAAAIELVKADQDQP